MMGYELLFKSCRFTGKLKEQANPFTREPMSVPEIKPLTESEVDAVQAVVDGAGGSDDGCVNFSKFSDGGEAEFSTDFAEKAWMLFICVQPSPALINFIYNLLVAGNWAICLEYAVIKTPTTAIESPPDKFPQIIECHSADELGELLASGIYGGPQPMDS